MRINAHLLVQRVDDAIVIADESSGQEILLSLADVAMVQSAFQILTRLS